MRTNKNLLAVLAGVLLLQACGSNTTRNVDTSSNSNNSTTGGGTTGTQTGNVYNLPAAQEQEIQMSGDGGPTAAGTITVSTSRTLRIKITPEAAPHLTVAPYTNWVFPYGCLKVTVRVNGTQQTTKVLKVGGVQQAQNSACKDAPESQILDFTNAATGSGTVSITFASPQYDNCRGSWPLYYGCALSAVWMNHMVAFNVATQVDGTWLE